MFVSIKNFVISTQKLKFQNHKCYRIKDFLIVKYAVIFYVNQYVANIVAPITVASVL